MGKHLGIRTSVGICMDMLQEPIQVQVWVEQKLYEFDYLVNQLCKNPTWKKGKATNGAITFACRWAGTLIAKDT